MPKIIAPIKVIMCDLAHSAPVSTNKLSFARNYYYYDDNFDPNLISGFHHNASFVVIMPG